MDCLKCELREKVMNGESVNQKEITAKCVECGNWNKAESAHAQIFKKNFDTDFEKMYKLYKELGSYEAVAEKMNVPVQDVKVSVAFYSKK